MKYYYIKGDGFNVPFRSKVLDEQGLRKKFLQEEIECLQNSIGDDESFKINLEWVSRAYENKFSINDIKSYLEDFGYIVKEINEFDFFKYFGIAETTFEHSIRTNKEDKQRFLEFLKDITETLEYEINKGSML